MTKKKKSVFGFNEIEQMAASMEDNKQQQGDDLNKVNRETEQGKGTVTRGRKREQTDGSGNGKTGPDKTDGSVNRETNAEQTDGSENRKTGPDQTDGSGSGFIEQFKEKTTRKTVEETHRRQTYLIDKELIKRLDRLARRQPKGFKTAVINEGIRRVLDEVEGKSF